MFELPKNYLAAFLDFFKVEHGYSFLWAQARRKWDYFNIKIIKSTGKEINIDVDKEAVKDEDKGKLVVVCVLVLAQYYYFPSQQNF